MKTPSQLASRTTGFKPEDLLHVSHIHGRRLRGVFKVNVKHVYTVGQLKQVMSSRHGHSVVALLYHGVCLPDEHKLAHLIPDFQNMGAPRFSVLTRVHTEPQPGGISLHVKGLEGSTFILHVSARSTVADLVTAIIDYEAYASAEDIQITYAGKSLSALDSSLALTNCSLVSGSVVNVTGKLRGGGLATPVQKFVDMENMSALKIVSTRSWVLGDPIWKKLYGGLNVEGMCRNSFCEAFEEVVVCPKGFAVFNIAEVVHCPVCGSIFTPTTVGFQMCEWMFEGRKAGAHSIDMMSKWHTSGGKREYHRFDDQGGRNMAEWCILVIAAKPLPGKYTTRRLNNSKLNMKECAICFGTLTTTGPRISNNVNMACGHRAHSECMAALHRGGYRNCPTCRGRIVK